MLRKGERCRTASRVTDDSNYRSADCKIVPETAVRSGTKTMPRHKDEMSWTMFHEAKHVQNYKSWFNTTRNNVFKSTIVTQFESMTQCEAMRSTITDQIKDDFLDLVKTENRHRPPATPDPNNVNTWSYMMDRETPGSGTPFTLTIPIPR